VPDASGGQAAGYPPANTHPAAATRGFGRIFGLDPRIALLTVVIDAMLFGGDIVVGAGSGGVLLLPLVALSIPVGIVLGFITYKAQIRWYHDDRDSALIKGLILGLLTAIPTSIPGLAYGGTAGIAGLIHLMRRK
jgi:hypothetical protein